jgi:hypothetical protein
MSKIMHVEESQVINANATALYSLIRDYQVGHPAILPKPYFSALTIEQGGQGAGTIVTGSLTAFGTSYPLHQLVSEPDPGHVLMETDIESGQYTTFTFEPLNGGSQTRVTIASEFPMTPGLIGLIEKLTKPLFVRRLYKQELGNLAQYIPSKSMRPTAG